MSGKELTQIIHNGNFKVLHLGIISDDYFVSIQIFL